MAIEAGCVSRRRSSRPKSKCNRHPTATTLQASLELGRLAGFAARWRMAPRSLGCDRRHERPQIILGAGASTGAGGFPSFRLLCAMSLPQRTTHEIRHRPTHRRTRFARAAQGQARRVARASRLGHAGPDAFARCAGRMRRREAHGRLRSAAWPARRQAGQHDRVAGLPRSGARHSGLQPVRRGAQADGCDDGYIRRHARRSAGSGLPHLYVHHDVALCPGNGGEARKAVWVLDRPNPVGRPVEGLRLRAGWESFVGAGRCRCVTG